MVTNKQLLISNIIRNGELGSRGPPYDSTETKTNSDKITIVKLSHIKIIK